jgi:hypothetical protein
MVADVADQDTAEGRIAIRVLVIDNNASHA